jgi:hypothetical protein
VQRVPRDRPGGAPPAQAEPVERIRRRIVATGDTLAVHLLAVLTVARRRP